MDSLARNDSSIPIRIAKSWTRFLEGRSSVSLAVAALVITAALMFMYRPLSQAEEGDSAVYDYIAQMIVRGQTPYRDEIDIKAPGSFYLSALAMKAGRAVGLRDIIAARLLHILLAGLLSAVVFLVAESYLNSRLAGVLAVLSMLISQSFALWTVGGGQPKLPMILFGMLTLLLIAKNRPFLAGFCSMLSCLCWQPGLLFTGVAFLIFSAYLTSWRDLRAMKVLAGAAIPLATLLFYFRSVGALGELWTWTVVFNYSIYSRKALDGEGNALGHILYVVLKIYKADVALVVLSLAGFLTFGARRLREKLGGISALKSADLFRDAIVIAPLVYFAACLIRFNAGPYLIPFLPFVGIFFGWSIVELARIAGTSARLGKRNISWAPIILVALLILVAGYRGMEYRFEPILTLQDQDKTFQAVSSLLSDSETIYVHGTTEILVLLNRPNLNPYCFIDAGKDSFVAEERYGGSFAALVDEIEANAPKVVALSRLQRLSHRDELRRLVKQHYERLDLQGYDIYVRKQEAPM